MKTGNLTRAEIFKKNIAQIVACIMAGTLLISANPAGAIFPGEPPGIAICELVPGAARQTKFDAPMGRYWLRTLFTEKEVSGHSLDAAMCTTLTIEKDGHPVLEER
jgi:hypothetical protein